MPNFHHTARRPKGAFFISDPETGLREYDTLNCVHCGYIWGVRPGSGRERGFCLACLGPTCGRRRCDECVPYEKMIEQMEKGR